MKNLFLLLALITNVGYSADTYTTKAYRQPHALGLKRTDKSREFVRSSPHTFPTRNEAPVPGSYDLTAKVSPPENQGNCGSCWDFGITKALRSALMLSGKDPGVLAFNYLLNNCGSGPRQGGCDGGDFDAGESFLNGGGPWLESQDHYTQSEGRCKTGLAVAGTALTYKVVGTGNNPPTFQELATAISQNHMLVIDVAVAGSWESYSSGIYNGNGSGINHIINMVGYDCETSKDAQGNCVFNSSGQLPSGVGYLKVMNNWGTSWGEGGYMRTRWGKNQIAETAMYFEVVEQPTLPTITLTVPTNDVVYGDDARITVTAANATSLVVDGKVLPPEGGTIAEDASVLGKNTVTATAIGVDGQKVTVTAQYNVVQVPQPTPTPTPVPPAPVGGSGLPVWVWLLIAGAIIGIAFLVARIFYPKTP